VSAPAVAPAGGPTASPPRRWIRVVLTAAVLAMAGMWVYAFVFAPRDGVNPVQDEGWTDGALAACVAAGDALEPLVFRTQITDDNAAVELPKFVAALDDTVAILTSMLDEIEALPRSSERAVVIVPQWLADYRTFVDDVAQWTDRLRAGERAPFGVSKTESNIPIDERINTFATENRIKECRTDLLEF
jgi:hypothetical protein